VRHQAEREYVAGTRWRRLALLTGLHVAGGAGGLGVLHRPLRGLLRGLVLGRARRVLGRLGEVRCFGPVGAGSAEYLRALGVEVRQVYGLAEAGGAVAIVEQVLLRAFLPARSPSRPLCAARARSAND
jgi:long-subunit acyl-CoA synthetase (AMP-forming)